MSQSLRHRDANWRFQFSLQIQKKKKNIWEDIKNFSKFSVCKSFKFPWTKIPLFCRRRRGKDRHLQMVWNLPNMDIIFIFILMWTRQTENKFLDALDLLLDLWLSCRKAYFNWKLCQETYNVLILNSNVLYKRRHGILSTTFCHLWHYLASEDSQDFGWKHKHFQRIIVLFPVIPP